MADNALSEILDGQVELYTDPEHEQVTAIKAKKRPVGKVTVGVVNHGVIESTSSQTYMPVEPVEYEKVYHAIPANIRSKYAKDKTVKKELIEARAEMLDRLEEVKRKKTRLLQLASARAAKGATKHGI